MSDIHREPSRFRSSTGRPGRLLRFVFSLVFNLFLMLLVYRIFTPVFEGTDDITIIQFVNGSCGSFDPHMVYQNYLVGIVLSNLYRAFPLVPWYSWYQFIALCASFTAITYVLCCRIKKGAGFALALLVQSFAAFECYTSIQYTKTAGVLAAAGMFLVWNGLWGASDTAAAADGKDPVSAPGKILWADVLWGISLAALSIMGRYAQFAASAVLTAGIPLMMLLDAGSVPSSSGGKSAGDGITSGDADTSGDAKSVGTGKIFLRCCAAALVIGALFVSLVLFDKSMYDRDPEWKSYVDYNNTRSELMDYGMPDYDEYQEVYTRLGISRTAYDLFDTWNSGDTAVLSTEAMKELVAVRYKKRPGLSTAKDFLKEVPKGFLKNTIVKCFLVTFALWIIFGRHDRRALIAFAAETLLFGALYYYLFLRGRYLYNRVDVGLWMSALTVLLWAWKPEHKSMPVSAGRTVLILGVMALCAFVQIPGWKGRLTSHSQESIQERRENREQIRKISEDTDHLYVSKILNVSAAKSCGPFEPMPVDMLSNVVLLGGWKVNSVPYNAILRKYGFSNNPFEAITGLSENSSLVYLLDRSTDKTLPYLREYYNPRAKLEDAGTWNGVTMWKVVSEEE